MAEANGVHVAVSNPTFELWLILHFRDRTSFITNSEARHIRAECDQSTGKEVDGSLYMDKRKDAAKRAILLGQKHIGDATRFPNDNPSSGMHLLIRSVAIPMSLENEP
jgi:hypothetical protein